jgi:hypothetical protein
LVIYGDMIDALEVPMLGRLLCFIFVCIVM